jgi:hypothetical protein
MDLQRRLLSVYALASGGDEGAYTWLLAFHGWAHGLDDFVDEPGHAAAEAVDLCADAVVLFSGRFYREHAEALGPLLGVTAEKYRASLTAVGRLADVLRLGGNDVVLMVAYLRGGRGLMRKVADELWPIVQHSQLAETPL